MLYQDTINFVEDADQYQLYPFGSPEDYAAIQSMSGHGKEQAFNVFNFGYNNNSGLQYVPASYESPVTNQSDLAALPNGYGSEYEDSYVYAPSQPEEYTQAALPPTTSTSYSTALPSTTQTCNAYSVGSNSRKRKASIDSYHSEAPSTKRIAVQDPNGDYYDLKSEPSPYSSFVPTPTALPASHLPYHLTGSPRAHGHQHSASNASQISLAATAPYTPTVSPAFTTANTEHSPRAPATPAARPVSAASNPKLVRTSTITQHSPPALPSSVSLGHTQNFNPYTLYSPDSKARLHLEGNLDDVGKKWSEEELESRRKIVVFNREQKGNDIFASFEVVSQNDWKNHPRSVSCIWWAEKKEAYVTSVDTILLLEGIVAARFTVEEKNRIRRNLEGFKPDTVSKAKTDTEEFFKVIMGFPNPKPRNIEKDVKVFPWRILSIALQKIISKYSASYASTAASIQHQPKVYRPVEHHEYSFSTSPAPEYHNGMQMAAFPVYETHGRLSAPVTPAVHMSMPPHLAQVHDEHPGYGYGHVQIPHQAHVPYHGHPMTAPVAAPPQYWPQHSYTPEGPMPMAPASAPPTAYPRESFESVDFHHGARMSHYMHSGHH